MFLKLIKDGTFKSEEFESADFQEIYFEWLFTKKPNLSALEAVVEFNKATKSSLLINRKIAVIKS